MERKEFERVKGASAEPGLNFLVRRFIFIWAVHS
jgi:hypothetical protein